MTQRWKISEIIHGTVASVHWWQDKQQQALAGDQTSGSGRGGPVSSASDAAPAGHSQDVVCTTFCLAQGLLIF